MLSAEQTQQLSARIEVLLTELTQAVVQSQESAQTVELDQTRQGRLSRMDAMQGQAMAKAASARMQKQLQALKNAQQHLNEVGFGLCEECDEPIAWPRLHFDPSVLLCIGCAEAAES